jgi:hypothetical protein
MATQEATPAVAQKSSSTEVARLETWLTLIRDRARGMADVPGPHAEGYTRIAGWAEAALRGEKR